MKTEKEEKTEEKKKEYIPQYNVWLAGSGTPVTFIKVNQDSRVTFGNSTRLR